MICSSIHRRLVVRRCRRRICAPFVQRAVDRLAIVKAGTRRCRWEQSVATLRRHVRKIRFAMEPHRRVRANQYQTLQNSVALQLESVKKIIIDFVFRNINKCSPILTTKVIKLNIVMVAVQLVLPIDSIVPQVKTNNNKCVIIDLFNI